MSAPDVISERWRRMWYVTKTREKERKKKHQNNKKSKRASREKKKSGNPFSFYVHSKGCFGGTRHPVGWKEIGCWSQMRTQRKAKKYCGKQRKKKKRSSLTLPVAYTQVACIYERKRALLHTHEDGKLGPGQVGPDTMTLRFVGNTFPSPFKFLVPSTSFLSFFCVSLVFCLFVRLV